MRVLLVLILGLAHSAVAQQVETPSGKLVGSVSEHADSISVFKGIPYALAPTGARRWTYAKRTRLARRAQRHSLQSGLCTAPLSRGLVFARSSEPTSEDCLYLNVWSPMSKTKPLPVMVWIHGGALTPVRVQ